MSDIHVAIIDKHKLLMEGLSIMLEKTSDIKVLIKTVDTTEFKIAAADKVIHVLILNLHVISNSDIAMVEELVRDFPSCKILVVSLIEAEETVYKIIKAGTKGFLSKDTSQHELIKAVYSLRNGFDYFSKCITTILLEKYVNMINANVKDQDNNLAKLSSREIEILKLWGESFSNAEIADKLFISIRTVESHKTHIMQKLNLKTTVDLIKYAIRNNIIEL